LDILNYNMLGYANISARDMLNHLFETYDNITAVDLEINFEHMRRAWDPQQPVETLFKQIQDSADYSEAGGVLIGHLQQINVGYAKIFATEHFMSACCRRNEKPSTKKLGPTSNPTSPPLAVSTSKCRENLLPPPDTTQLKTAVTQSEDQMAEATVGALENLATATAADRGVVAALTQANSRLAKQLNENSSELRESKALLNQERRDKRGPRSFNPYSRNYCWTHGYKVGKTHMSLTCNTP
jgi:hypothetical protein